ncbi:MAG: L-lactate dehydrogenase [Lawsonibacter sp.]
MESRKVVILGAGHVGSHCACALADAGVCEEIVLVDRLPEKAAAQALDVADSVSFLPHAVTVRAGGYEECRGAGLVVVAIGEPRLPGQTRLDLLGRSAELLKGLVEELKPLGLACPVVTITNPADIAADYMRKGLGLERWRCFGTGALLDTARLVRCIARRAGVDPRSVSAFSMGEHGDSSMVPFSAVTVGGVPFDRLGIDKEIILEQTRRAGMEIIEGKGSTEFGIGRALAVLAGCILRDEKRILPVSVLLDGEYGQRGVHCGVPCRIGKDGVEEIISLQLTQEEQQLLDASCRVIKTHIDMAASL